jgi:hypothetical protein
MRVKLLNSAGHQFVVQNRPIPTRTMSLCSHTENDTALFFNSCVLYNFSIVKARKASAHTLLGACDSWSATSSNAGQKWLPCCCCCHVEVVVVVFSPFSFSSSGGGGGGAVVVVVVVAFRPGISTCSIISSSATGGVLF